MNDQNWQKDSDMIFDQITNGDFPDFTIAQQAVCSLYVLDRSISRAGISHALGRLERHYRKAQPPESPPNDYRGKIGE